MDSAIKCTACMRFCRIREGGKGICGNYANLGGKLLNVGYGLLSSIESRPIEIKPFFHYWPGSSALTFSNWGCNLYCPWCQNHGISFSRPPLDEGTRYAPNDLVRMARALGDEGLCASFNEPATQVDFLLDVFSLGKKEGLYSTVVTNGYFSRASLEALIESGCDGLSVDVKGCPEAHARILRGVDPNAVLSNAKYAIDLGAHVEVVFLVVPGFNDDDCCIKWIVEKHVSMLGEDVPLHINRYYPAHKYTAPPTPLEKLLAAKKLAKEHGARFVYVGNVGLSELESTYCPNCGKLLIARSGYNVLAYDLSSDHKCPRCNTPIPLRGSRVKKGRRWRVLF
ncbi:MAG: radical SAM protein [Candidatus Terraquivivens tikiterensis]|uniref:Radical SAM protein n=1 Tax=Candidatus Terraquivivens tikiterensis TaxID=1980982 RepID=A0A2R7Y2X6_9ARCH|nr:MAG: radical SAM protein [Candidatus Terraquivivens tikiterensis]